MHSPWLSHKEHMNKNYPRLPPGVVSLKFSCTNGSNHWTPKSPSSSSSKMMILGSKFTMTPLFQPRRVLTKLEQESVMKIFYKKREIIGVDGQGSPISITLVKILKKILCFLKKEMSVFCDVKSVNLIGGAATYVVFPDYVPADIDLRIDIQITKETNRFTLFNIIFEEVRKILSQAFGAQCSSKYIKKKFLYQLDGVPLWNLISLNSSDGCHVDIKFNVSDERSYIMFGDSLQIDLLPELEKTNGASSPKLQLFTSTGHLQFVIDCLKEKFIYTRNPIKVYGGGVLKYANLVEKGFTDLKTVPQTWEKMEEVKKEMVAKFLSDFYTSGVNDFVIEKYINTHYEVSDATKVSEMRQRRLTFLDHFEKLLVDTAADCEEEPMQNALKSLQTVRQNVRDPGMNAAQVNFSPQNDETSPKPALFDESDFPALS